MSSRAILHVDGDGFFASCEQAMHPEFRGRPVVTGSERGIITSASVEAKALGIGRQITPWEAKKICPALIFVNSDYHSYQLFSYRLASILRRYTPDVEHYSIDEAFADLTGLRRTYGCSYDELAKRIKEDIINGLGLTVSVGVAPTKTLAKVASKWQKPNGLTVIPSHAAAMFLARLTPDKIWGIGSQTAARLQKMGCRTALDFAQLPEKVIEQLEKPLIETWLELNGESVLAVASGPGEMPKSLVRSHTFKPASADPGVIAQELRRNLEEALWRLRKTGLGARRISFMVKTQDDFKTYSHEVLMPRPTAWDADLAPFVRPALAALLRPGVVYRTTGVSLTDLVDLSVAQTSMFDVPGIEERLAKLYEAADELRRKYHRPVVRTGSVRLKVVDGHTLENLRAGVMLPVAPPRFGLARLAFL